MESAGKTIKETTEKTYDGAKSGLLKGTEVISKTIKEQKQSFNLRHPSSCPDFLTEIDSRLFSMPFPDEEVALKYAKLLNKEHEGRYRIWNVSEFTYNTGIFNDQVYEYVYVGYPNPPLLELFMVCKEMAAWLDAHPENITIVHCQKSMIRSCLVLGCFFFLRGATVNPSESVDMLSQVRDG